MYDRSMEGDTASTTDHYHHHHHQQLTHEDDIWSGHAALSYDDVENAGPPTRPLDFPTPRVHRAEYVPVTAVDHRNGRRYELQKVLIRAPNHGGTGTRRGDRNRTCCSEDEDCCTAYLMKKKVSKTTYGSVRLCVVLRRRQRRPSDESGKDENQEAEAADVEAAAQSDANCGMWQSTDELVAIKCSSWQKIRQSRGKHLEDPIKEVASLQYIGNYHAHVLGCIEVLQDDDYLYTVMPYCSGGDLYREILGDVAEPVAPNPAAGGPAGVRSGSPARAPSSRSERSTARRHRPNEQQARIWFRQLLDALFHLQKKGVCHRDVSLENIVLDEKNNINLIDTGLALRVPYTDSTNYGGVSDFSEGSLRRLMLAQGQGGNLTFLAPEIVERRDAFDGFAADLWSAGVVLFVLLVGLAPFRWAHSTDLRFKQISMGHLRGLVQSMDIPLSPDACDLLQSMMWRDPRRRMNLAQVMHHPWVLGEEKGNENLCSAADNRVDLSSTTVSSVHATKVDAAKLRQNSRSLPASFGKKLRSTLNHQRNHSLSPVLEKKTYY